VIRSFFDIDWRGDGGELRALRSASASIATICVVAHEQRHDADRKR
jgi:hypothetical protein